MPGSGVAPHVSSIMPHPEDSPRFSAIAATPAVLDDAARRAAIHGLRAHDAVQLASARATVAADPDCTTFAAFDKGLRTAAAAEGFRLLPGSI